MDQPLHSAASLGYCNSCGILQDPEWRNACWKKLEAVAEGWKTVVEVGNHSCDTNALAELLWKCGCLPPGPAGCSQGSLWPKLPVGTRLKFFGTTLYYHSGLNTNLFYQVCIWHDFWIVTQDSKVSHNAIHLSQRQQRSRPLSPGQSWDTQS